MARARNLKPGFFTNDSLAQCEPLARILFQGLWCWCDREGRLENRPKRLKAEILPYDECDVPNLLLQLAAAGFIVCYTIGNHQFIQVVNFGKHQKPHPKEAVSEIPAPTGAEAPVREERTQPVENVGTISSREKTRLVPENPEPAVEKLERARPLPSSPIPHPSSSEAYASAPIGAPQTPLDLKAELWRIGKLFLAKHGIGAKQAGSLLGGWRKKYGDSAVIAALAAAEAEVPGDVIEFIIGCLRRQANGKRIPPEPSRQDAIVASFGEALGLGDEDAERPPDRGADCRAA